MPRQSREKSGTGIYQMIIGTVPLIGDNLNYPREVQFTNGDRIQYIYSPDGQKLRATWQTAVANIVVPLNSTVNLSSSQISSTTRTDYIGNVIYTGTASSSSASVKLSKYLFEGGYATVTPTTQPKFHYYTQDHLGNNRAVVNQSGTVEQITHYYPFGGFFADQGTGSSLQPYKYNGKELDRMHGLDLYDYGFRQYDPVVPMFTQQDPMAEKYYHLSPYAYCANNPVSLIDLDGKEPTDEEAAQIAAHVYGDKKEDILTGGWRVSTSFKISNKSGLKSQVYERVNNDGEVTEYVYATAGTEPDDIEDWIANVAQVAGLSNQYHLSAENAQKISKQLGEKELNFVGHSLGGGEAALNSLLTFGNGIGRKAFTFNAAGVSMITKIREGGIDLAYKSENSINAYITITDPLNILQNGTSFLPNVNGIRKYVLPNRLNGHSIDNFY